jgi:hypothetical protein
VPCCQEQLGVLLGSADHPLKSWRRPGHKSSNIRTRRMILDDFPAHEEWERQSCIICPCHGFARYATRNRLVNEAKRNVVFGS